MESLSQAPRTETPPAPGWQFWIDRGGTFTDVIGLSPAGELHVRKVPSARAGGKAGDPGLMAVRAILDAAPASGRRVSALKVGTTVATNALLTRAGEPVVLVTTLGFADALRIGYQNRPDIFARHIVLPEQLYAEVIEARERVAAEGEVLLPLDSARLREDLERARGRGRRAVAIVFLHAWRHPAHERSAASLAR
ncbi:MAG TPA: hydantoinase/oxoprolinase N-terminal domain-containing protein, partial [Steroidobacteraceae bacterium]|nr:hydantoinase/oxoprolinase N-terminal domain-containing protein [Steroidobacteraceae bacterium]